MLFKSLSLPKNTQKKKLMIEKDLVEEYLNKITNSKQFTKATNSVVLLRYLVWCSVNNQPIKESIIGLELFGTPFFEEKNNSRVRVSVYNLRKQLKKYYDGEGKKDKIIFDIPKGQYKTEFLIRKEVYPIKQKLHRLILPLMIIISVCSTTISIIKIQDDTSSKNKETKIPFWSSFLTNGKNNSIYVGDLFFMYGPGIFGRENVLRDYTINNIEDFDKTLKQDSEIMGKYTPAPYTYLTVSCPYLVNRVSNFFSKYNESLDLKLSSKTGYSEIVSENAIYVGSLTNKNRFVPLFNFQSNNIKIEGANIAITYPDSSKLLLSSGLSLKNIDYSIVSCIAGPENTEQFHFFSSHDIGIITAIDYFTNIDSLETFKNGLPKGHKHFSAVYKSSGLERTKMKTELVFMESYE